MELRSTETSPNRSDSAHLKRWAEEKLGIGHPSIHLPVNKNIVPIITPLDPNGLPITDPSILQKYLVHIKALGSTDLFVLGETGEFRFLANSQREKFAKALVPLAKDSGFRVFVNATAEEYSTTRENYFKFTELGADAIIFAPLWGINEQIFSALLNRGFQNGPPIILYNNPGITHDRNIAAGDLKEVAPFIGAVKDSSGDLARIHIYRTVLNTSLAGSPRLYIGDEFMAMDSFGKIDFDGAVGSSGVVSNHLARRFANSSDIEDPTQFSLEFKKAMNDISEGRSKMVAGLKEFLYLQHVIPFAGLCANNRESELSPDGRAKVAEILKSQPSWAR